MAVSSYQGGRVEYFTYLRELLDEAGPAISGSTAVVAGSSSGRDPTTGVTRVTIFRPEDGQRLGLPGMISTIIADCDVRPVRWT